MIIFTTRSTKKGSDTLARLQEHLNSNNDLNPADKNRVTFVPENVDLCDLVSVRTLSRRVLQNFPKLDAIVLNAGLGGWTGIDWPRAVFGVLTDLVHEVSWPSYKIAPAGVVTERQTAQGEKGVEEEEEPRLGMVFCANVFGHYMLAHNVMPLLKRSGANGTGAGRVIWVSSLEATVNFFDINDIQGLRTTSAYESSKALTDILALTSNLPSTAPWVNSFYSVDNDKNDTTTTTPNTYLSHPGICGTTILPLPLPCFYAMIAIFWFARLLGSPWHTLSTYLGACAPVWLAFSAQPVLDDAEAPYLRHGGGRAKWGSAYDLFGSGPASHPASTEVDGWGYGGVVGSAVVDADRWRRRKRGARDLEAEEKTRFEELGRECWRQMEDLRIRWDGLLDKAGV